MVKSALSEKRTSTSGSDICLGVKLDLTLKKNKEKSSRKIIEIYAHRYTGGKS